jgi:hypothetical protein
MRGSNSENDVRAFIEARCRELGIRPVELIERCGYGNISKGLRRLDDLYSGAFAKAAGLISRLPRALDVPDSLVKKLIDEAQRRIQDEKEAAWLQTFKPHAIIITERNYPQPLFVAALYGVEALLRIDLDVRQKPISYLQAALTVLQNRSGQYNGTIPSFGKPTGVVINYQSDRAVHFDIGGKPIRVLGGAYRIGMVQTTISGREITDQELEVLLGK